MNKQVDVAMASFAPAKTASALIDECIDDVPSPFCLIGFDGCFHRVNELWSRAVGHPAHLLIGKRFARFVHPDDASLLVRQLCDPNCEAPPESFEARLRCADGHYKWFHCEARPLEQQRLFAIVALDISERKDAEHVLKRRAAVASLKADLWTVFGRGAASDEILGIWTDLVQRHLELLEVQIWTRDGSGSELVLKARSGMSPVAQGASDYKLLEDQVRQVGETDQPLIIPDASFDPRIAPRLKPFEARAIRGVILHPLRTAEHVIAILAVFFPKPCGSQEAGLIDTVASEIGNALARLLREEELLESRRHRDRLLGTRLVGFCRVNADQTVVAWSGGAEALLQWSAADVLGHPLPIATEESQSLLDAGLSGALSGQSTEKLETTLRTRVGTTIDVWLSIAPESDATGRWSGAWLTFTDQSDRKRCQRLLAAQRRITELVAGSSSIDEAMSAVLSALGTTLSWDVGEFWEPTQTDKEANTPDLPRRRATSWHSESANAAEFNLSTRNDDTSGMAEFVDEVLDAKSVRYLPAFSAKRNLARSELAARCGLGDAIGIPLADGGLCRGALVFFASEIREPDALSLSFLGAIGEELGLFLRLRQTQQSLVDARQEVLQANKMDTVGRLVGGVVHDFNNLLTIILGYGELVLEESAASSASRDSVSQVLDAGKRAAGLTRQLLGFCRKEAAEPIAVNLNAHIAEMQKMIGRLIGEQIVLSTDLAADAGYVRFAPAHLEQVIMNLVVNARDAMPSGGQLKIQTQFVDPGDRELRRFSRVPLGRYALLSVSDSGCGMDQTTRQRIFEPFFTTKGRDKGTGMGLATVFDLLANYEGRIEVESSPARGTTFFVLLPSVEPGLTPWQVDESPTDVPGGDETVLIVEDDDRVRQLMVRGLSARGYQVLSAADPARAFELCEQVDAHIDVLISDVMLPGIKGPELAIRVRSGQPSVRVLYVSGYGDADLKDAELVKSAAYLQKPFSTFDLALKVRELCDS